MTNIEGDKLWVKITFEKKKGRFTRLLEKMACFGLELTDASVTTSRGAMLVTSCVQVRQYILAAVTFFSPLSF